MGSFDQAFQAANGGREKRMNRYFGACVFALAALGLLLSCMNARAQTVPPKVPPNLAPGAIHQQNRQTQEYYEKQREQHQAGQENEPVVKAAGSQAGAGGNAKLSFVLEHVQFNHSDILSQAQLHAIVAPHLDQRATFATLQHIVAAVNQLYRKQHVVTAQAVLPPQTIHDGTVRIMLIEGKLGAIHLRGNRSTKTHFIRERIPVQAGQRVQAGALQRALVFFNRTSNVRLQALLEPGQSLGLTDVVLQAHEPPRMSGDVFVDNAGVDSTSRNRLGASFTWNNVFGITDRFDADVTHSRGDTDGALDYSLPFNRKNGRIFVSYSRASTQIVNGPFSKLDLTGHADTASVRLAQPLMATRRWLLQVSGAYSRIKASSDAAGVNISNSAINQWSGAFSAVYYGDAMRLSTTHVVSEAQTDQTVDGHGRFFIYNGSVSGLGQFGKHWAYQWSLAGQLASNDRLPPSLLFQLGGLGSVRGYERGVLAGPRGYVASAAVHRYIGRQWDLYGFIDHGQVFAAFPASAHINGAGLGAYWHPRNWVDVSLDVARPFDTVTSYQSGTRVDFRVNVHWDAD